MIGWRHKDTETPKNKVALWQHPLSTLRNRDFWMKGLIIAGLILIMALPRLTALNQYVIVDESDRWLWAEDFVYALHDGDLARTRIGHGYPGVFPAWAGTLWVFMEATRRSLIEGQWIGESGLYLIFHEWDRPAFLIQQRLPIVLLNTLLALAIIWAVWRLFGGKVALLSGLLIALDPFYLSDSRLNRAEAIITGLMTLSVLALIFYYRRRRWRYVLLSGCLGGLALLTKIQALIIAPAVALTGFLIYADDLKAVWAESKPCRTSLSLFYKTRFQKLTGVIGFGLVWLAAACLIWIVLWPAMWVTPARTLAEVYDYATHMSGASGALVFFLGQAYEDADPGLLFYPLVFLMRITPLALFGLIGLGLAGLWGWRSRRGQRGQRQAGLASGSSLDAQIEYSAAGISILIIYIVVYALAISVGSHKQDRYLMPAFLSINILAAMGLVCIWSWLKSKLTAKPGQDGDGSKPKIAILPIPYLGWGLLALLVVIQLATVLPHHPYYFSYFNPLVGGGQTAVQTLRVGWGEGMDQVGRYLAAKPNSRDLVVSTRFTHYMPDFKGEVISLGAGGRWTQADYIVLYIQQVQRNQDPSPAFIDYFQARVPEKVITVGGIDYAWIYPIPFTTPADPQVSLIPDKVALLGYSWEETGAAFDSATQVNRTNGSSTIRLLWKNLDLDGSQTLLARLVGAAVESDWVVCQPAPDFINHSQTPGSYVESLCTPATTGLSPGLYTVEFGLASVDGAAQARASETIETFLFPESWQAARLMADGQVEAVPRKERFDVIARETVPATARFLKRVYDERLRLVAYQLEPAQPQPGQTLDLILYWQPLKDVTEFQTLSSNANSWRTDYYQPVKKPDKSVRLVVQLADSRSISLGRLDVNLPTEEWFIGEVVATHHQFELDPDLDSPLAAQVEVTLFNEADVPVQATNLDGQALGIGLTRFTIAPERWPEPDKQTIAPDVEATWQGDISLRGYQIPEQVHPGEAVPITLFWATTQSISENYVAFIHLLDETNQIVAQSDALPRAGAYPTPWWQPGQVIEDTHTLALSQALPPGRYSLIVGLYRSEDFARLPLVDGGDHFPLDQIVIP